MELMGPSGRIFAGMVVCVFFGSAMCLLGVVASLIREWSMLTVVCNVPFVLLFSYWWYGPFILFSIPTTSVPCPRFLPESPRWLVAANKIDDASKAICKIAKYNKFPCDHATVKRQCVLRPLPKTWNAKPRSGGGVEEELYEQCQIESNEAMSDERAQLMDLFRMRNLRKKTVIITFIWSLRNYLVRPWRYSIRTGS